MQTRPLARMVVCASGYWTWPTGVRVRPGRLSVAGFGRRLFGDCSVMLNRRLDVRTPAGRGDAPAPWFEMGADEAYVVSGAGSAEWNGLYSKAGTAYGAPLYTKDKEHSLYRYDGVWRLAVKGKWTAYDAPNDSGANTPPSDTKSGSAM